MAEKKQVFLSYFKDQVTDWFNRVKDAASSVVRWVTNLASGKSWSENNQSLWDIITWKASAPSSVIGKTATVPQWDIKKSTTLNDVASWSGTTTWPQLPDISTPNRDLLWINSLWGQDDIKMDDDSTLSQVSTGTDLLHAREIIEWAWIKSEDQVKENEEKVNWENWRDTAKSFWRSAKELVSNIIDYPRERWQNKAVYQSNEKKVAVWYDPESRNIMQLAINEGQWLTDDFNATLFKKWKWNSKVFSDLYQEYNNWLDAIASSNLDWQVKAQLANELHNKFKQEVQDRQLIKVYENDYYSDWLFYPIFDKESTRVGRMKDKFTQDELDNLSKSEIKKWWIYELTDKQFDDFLEAYQYNNELRSSIYWKDDEDDENKLLVQLEDNAQQEATAAQSKYVMNWVNQTLNAKVELWEITPVQRNEIYNRVMNVVDDRIDKMWTYMWWPLAYYRLVQNKNPGDMTDWERATLWFWPSMVNVMEDYVGALSRWANETVNTWINDEWELADIPDTIDWKAINDFFNDAIRDNVIRAGGVDMLWNESALDAMQLLGQNINHLYWQWKWNKFRQAYTEAAYNFWQYWYTAQELFQLWANYLIWWWLAQTLWADTPARAEKAQDYHRADWSTAALVETDEEWHWRSLWNEDLARLIKEYWLKFLDIAWETAWMIVAEKPFFWWVWSAAKNTARWLNATRRTMEAAAKAERTTWVLWNLYNSVKGAIWNTRAAWWTRQFLNKVSDAISVSPATSAKARALLELWKNWLSRVTRDQLIDLTSTYLDTESYSTPSFWLSMWFTWLFEALPAIFKDTQLLKIISNKARWLNALDGTWWKMIDYMTSDPEVMKWFERFFWTNNPTFKQLKTLWQAWWWSGFEDALKIMYNRLNPEAKLAMNNFSKRTLVEQIWNLSKIDWQSSYGRWLRAILDAQWTNGADVIKYIFGIPGKVDVWWFTSSILFKEWWQQQTRYLKKSYDTALDNIEWWFRKRLQEWFTVKDVADLASNTKYKDLMKDWRVNENLFELWEDGKYILNADWAKRLWLDVSDYTEAMARQDIIKKQARETMDLFDDKLKQLANGKWISDDTIKKVVDSWTFNRMIDEFQKVLC